MVTGTAAVGPLWWQDRFQHGQANGIPPPGDVEGELGSECPDGGGAGALPLGPQQAEMDAVATGSPGGDRDSHRWFLPSGGSIRTG